MNNTLVLMTALVPTVGHQAVVEFAASLPDTQVWVLVSDRTMEPTDGDLRARALQEALHTYPNVTIRCSLEDEAPQQPEDHQAFWDWWKNETNRTFPEAKGQWAYVVASEGYGLPMAETLNAHYMPYDENRALNPVKGTTVRRAPDEHWSELLPCFRQAYTTPVVLFGADSTGKTTLSKLLSERMNGQWLFEYARPYLDRHQDEAVTSALLEAVHRGQRALQIQALKQATRPLQFWDTDLYTTMGFWGLMGEEAPEELKRDAAAYAGELYLLLPDDAPFERDPFRYGGHERESSREYWLELLKREGLNFVEVPEGSMADKLEFMEATVEDFWDVKWAPIANFER